MIYRDVVLQQNTAVPLSYDMQDMHIIAGGSWASTNGADGLKMVPVGMGLLITTGALPDARALYCPTAVDYDWTLIGAAKRNCEVRDWERAQQGSVNAKDARSTLESGDWPVVSGSTTKTGYIASHYINLNPAIGRYMGHFYTSDTAVARELPMAWTTPVVKSNVGAPPFKTPNALRGRALAADNFWRKYVDATPAGFGAHCHEEGYNVLYGDGSVNWYSDIEQRIIWYPTISCDPRSGMGGYYTSSGRGLGSSYHYAWNLYGERTPTTGNSGVPNSSYKEENNNADDGGRLTPRIRHLFDEARGIDVGAPLGSVVKVEYPGYEQ